MALVPLTTPFNMKDATLQLGDVSTFEGLSAVTLTPSAGNKITLISGRTIQDPATWTLDLGAVGDLAKVGLTRFAFDHEGEEVPFTLTCAAEADPIVGKVTVSPLAIGGTAGSTSSANSSWSVSGKPSWDVAA